MRRIGVGFQPLHGLKICGQFEMAINTSRSASHLDKIAGPGRPFLDLRLAAGKDGYAHEEVEIGGNVA